MAYPLNGILSFICFYWPTFVCWALFLIASRLEGIRKTIDLLKNWRFLIVVLEKTLKSPLDSKEITPVIPKGNQPCIFIWRSDPEAEAPILWPPDVKSWLIGKDSHAGKDWRQEEEVMTEDEMVGWHHQLNGHEFEQAPGNGEEQGNLTCYGNGVTKSPTWLSNWTTTTKG